MLRDASQARHIIEQSVLSWVQTKQNPEILERCCRWQCDVFKDILEKCCSLSLYLAFVIDRRFIKLTDIHHLELFERAPLVTIVYNHK